MEARTERLWATTSEPPAKTTQHTEPLSSMSCSDWLLDGIIGWEIKGFTNFWSHKFKFDFNCKWKEAILRVHGPNHIILWTGSHFHFTGNCNCFVLKQKRSKMLSARKKKKSLTGLIKTFCSDFFFFNWNERLLIQIGKSRYFVRVWSNTTPFNFIKNSFLPLSFSNKIEQISTGSMNWTEILQPKNRSSSYFQRVLQNQHKKKSDIQRSYIWKTKRICVLISWP